ncbi:MAG: D-serine ammonia-lyase [Cohaesibacter sp.]|jgi:D-serine dehydratase|nr:D-serine ammonia-lyase [Cohaesibacter sp.]
MTDNQAFLARLKASQPVVWINSRQKPSDQALRDCHADLGLGFEDVIKACDNWQALAPLLAKIFPQLEATGGRIDSPLLPVPQLQKALGQKAKGQENEQIGHYLLKADHALPVAGSVKARGGIYEVCMHAWSLATELGLMSAKDDPITLADEAIRQHFSNYVIAVGSTGNLGLSVGLAARALGFKAVVHMSSDAKAWKVKRLEDNGVEVIQHDADYGKAVGAARIAAAPDPNIYFVDDECSQLLFFGYSAAAVSLKKQLADQGRVVSQDHPLFLYLPCGIGGAPGGVAFGVKYLFGDHAHCFFVEPVEAPCALVQLMSGLEKPVTVYDFGLTNKTEADGMAVAEVSHFVAKVMEPMLSGVITAKDEDLLRFVALAHDHEGLKLEPSAAAGLGCPQALFESQEGQAYLAKHGLSDNLGNAHHIIWATGGSLVPQEQFERFLEKGRAFLD